MAKFAKQALCSYFGANYIIIIIIIIIFFFSFFILYVYIEISARNSAQNYIKLNSDRTKNSLLEGLPLVLGS